MEIEYLIVGIVAGIALVLVGRRLYRSLRPDRPQPGSQDCCPQTCPGCQVVGDPRARGDRAQGPGS
jgi:hypothetical protein